MSKAILKKINGRMLLDIDGEIYPPMFFTGRTCKPDYMKRLRDAGMRVFFVYANTDWMRPGRQRTNPDGYTWWEKSGFEAFCEEAERLVSRVPDAYIIIRIGMHPSEEWARSHPDDMVRYEDGETIAHQIFSEIHCDDMPASYSLCSENWRRDGSAALEDFCNKVDASPYGKHVIGYFLAAGGTSEWYYMNRLIDRYEHAPDKPDRVADFSPAFRTEFSKYLRKKYNNNEDELKRCWKLSDASFDSPLIPPLAERDYIRGDDAIVRSISNLENKTLDNLEDSTHLGVFYNFNRGMNLYDFHRAWHEGTANSIVHFAKFLKEKYNGDKVVGAFYGSFGHSDYYDGSTNTGTEVILDSGYVDFLASPGVYNNREPGCLTAQRELIDSFTLRDSVFISEDDIRTHLDKDAFRNSMEVFTPEDTVKVLKREFGRNICQGTYSWWFDQFLEGGRYDGPEILELFSRQQEIAKEAVLAAPKRNEIAIMGDTGSVHTVSYYTNSYMLDFYRTVDLNRIGAGVDYYNLNDMALEEMPDYKLYIMLNSFCLSDKQRDMIAKKAAKNRATVLWLYAPGFINPDTPDMKVENISQLVGMKVGKSDKVTTPKFDIVSDHPAVKYAEKGKHYGFLDTDVHSNVWLGSEIKPLFVAPAFHIEEADDITVLGRYCIDGKIALAMKEHSGFNSVYCGAQVLSRELLRGLAEYAGCHIYGYDSDTLYISEEYILLHAAFTGKHTLHLKAPSTLYEVYEEKIYGEGVDTLVLDMVKGDTLMFKIHTENL